MDYADTDASTTYSQVRDLLNNIFTKPTPNQAPSVAIKPTPNHAPSVDIMSNVFEPFKASQSPIPVYNKLQQDDHPYTTNPTRQVAPKTKTSQIKASQQDQANENANIIKELDSKNYKLKLQFQSLTLKLEDIQKKMAENPRQPKKPCDHAEMLNLLETQLKSKENEYQKAFEIHSQELLKQEKILAATNGQIKQVKQQIDAIKKQNSQQENQKIGSDRINELQFRLKECQDKTAKLQLDIKAMQRINAEQHNEIERIEESKGYTAKIEQLLSELAIVNKQNDELKRGLKTSLSSRNPYKGDYVESQSLLSKKESVKKLRHP